MLLQIAQTGNLDGACIINDIGLANELASLGVPYVVWRPVHGTGDGHERPAGDKSDLARGIARWRSAPNREGHTQLDPRVYIQSYGCNEQNYTWPTHDGYFYLGMMQAANDDGRKLAIFADGVGHPRDLRWEGSYFDKAISETWKARVDSGCMEWGTAHGDLACLHEYGRCEPDGKPTSDPGSAIWPDGHRDEEIYIVYGGRHTTVWRDIIQPEKNKMLIAVLEAGPSDAVYRGPDALLSDGRGYIIRYKPDPNVVCFCLWTTGRGGGDPGDFAHSAIDLALPDVLRMLAAR